MTISSESWGEIKTLANQASQLYEEGQTGWQSMFEQFTHEMNQYKQICNHLKKHVHQLQNDQKSCRRDEEEALKGIANAYNKNRLLAFNVFEEIAQSTLDTKLELEKRNIKQQSQISRLDQDMDDAISEVHNTVSSSRNETGLESVSQRDRQNIQYSSTSQDQVITPRTQQQISARRGRFQQQPQQKESQRQEILPPIPFNQEIKKVNIPPLPIYMINNSKEPSNSNRGGGIPPAPTSHRNNNNGHSQPQLSGRQPSSRRNNPQLPRHENRAGHAHQNSNQLSQRSGRGSSRRNSSRQPIDSKRSDIVDPQYLLVNPVFLGAAYQTSRFDKGLEDDYEDAEQTLMFETERLKQFGEEYEMLLQVDNEDERIILKQLLFMQHERELKGQAKYEKAVKLEKRRAQRLLKQEQNQASFDGTTPRGRINPTRNDENDQTIKDPSYDAGQRHSDNKNNDISMIGSYISVDNEQLPLLDTIEMKSARRKEVYNEVKLDQLLDVSSEIRGLIKTLTEKSLVLKIEEEFKQKEELLREDRKVLDWSSQEGDSSLEMPLEQRHSANTSIESHVRQVSNSKQLAKRRKEVFNIKDMQARKHNERTPDDAHNKQIEFGSSGSNASINSNVVIDMNLVKKPVERKEFKFPVSEEEDEEGEIYSNGEQQFNLQQHEYLNQINIEQLEVIHERQSELSSSINTNNRQLSRLSSHRNKKSSQINNLMVIAQPRRLEHRVLSARDGSPTPQSTDKLQRVNSKASLQQIEDYSSHKQAQYKRAKSHRQSLQSAPNSQRGKVGSKQIGQEAYNFHSIQIDESQCEDYSIQKSRISNSIHDKRPVTDLGVHQNTLSSGLSFEDSRCKNKLESEVHKNQLFARRHSPMLHEQQCQQHFSSIQNQFGDSCNSGFKNESIFREEGSVRLNRSPKAISDRDVDYRDELCDFDEDDLNQIHEIYSKFVPYSYAIDSSMRHNQSKNDLQKQNQAQWPFQQNKIAQNSISLSHPFLQNNNTNNNNINSSQLLQGNQSNQSALGGLLFQNNTQNHNQSNLFQSRGLFHANMVTNFLQNYTQGQMTKDVPSSKKTDHKGPQMHGQSGFTLSTLGDETLMYMFPNQKTTRRTLLLLKNFNNNYYNNCAGVLFTMPISTGELNNGFLQQSTAGPSADQELCNGGLTQVQGKQLSKHMRQHHHLHNLPQSQTTNLNKQATGGTQDSFNKEDMNLQRFYKGQFYQDPRKHLTGALTKNINVGALSTGESGTLKSTAFAANQFRFNQLAHNQMTQGVFNPNPTQLVEELSPRQSFDINDKNLQNLSSDFKYSSLGNKQIVGKMRASSQNPSSVKLQGRQVDYNRPHISINSAQQQAESQISSMAKNSTKTTELQTEAQKQPKNIRIICNKVGSNNNVISKLQLIAGNAQSTAISQGINRSFQFKKPSIVRQHLGVEAVDISGDQSTHSISRIIKQ